MTTTILLVRHGQTESNVTGFYMGWSDQDLNEAGYTQVESLSARLASLPITAAYTSPLRRTYNTAATIARPHNLELNLLDDVVEIPVWGLPYSHNVATAAAMALYEYCRQFPDG